jgi:hypothetical protein
MTNDLLELLEFRRIVIGAPSDKIQPRIVCELSSVPFWPFL